MFSIFQLDRRRKIAEIKIAVLVNILCVANSTQWNNYAQLKKKNVPTVLNMRSYGEMSLLSL